MSNNTDGGYSASNDHTPDPWSSHASRADARFAPPSAYSSSAQSDDVAPQSQGPSLPRESVFSQTPPRVATGDPSQSAISAGPFQSASATPETRVTRARRTRVWPAVVTASFASAALATAGTFAVLNTTPSVESADAGTTQVQTISQLVQTDLESVVASVADTVVAIDVTSQSGESLGSGVIIDASGYILTNNHVVSGARQIQVTLADGRIFPAQIVGTDPTTDLAVILLENPPSDLAVADLGDSSSLKVGQEVVAVGNPLGLSSTVTTGIVSALDRPVTTVDQTARELVVTNAIQVDAAINPGNSGGPIFNADGDVVGITSSIASTSQDSGSIGLGFAIPSNLASRVASEIIETGSATHAFLGVSMGDTSTTVDGVTRAGALVDQVVADSGAAEAGLRAGDVIVSIDGRTVIGAESLTGYVRQYTPGAQAVLGVVRNGELLELTATLGTSESDAG